MATTQLYYDRPDLDELDARVVRRFEMDGKPAVVLNESVFYPEGGGQPADRGFVDDIAVVEAVELGDEIALVLERPLPEGAESVNCRLDSARRRDHAQQHTAQHLLSAVILRLLGGATVSFHLGEDYSSIDVDLPAMDASDVEAVEAEIDRVILDEYPVTVHVCPPGNVEDFPLRKRPPAGEAVLRIVEIDGLDFSPCCGTHLAHTGRIRAFRVIKAEKYKGMTRVYFLAGDRALSDWKRLAGLGRELSRTFACSEDELPEKALQQKDRIAALESGRAAMVRERAALEAELALKDAGEGKRGCRVFRWDDRPFAEILETVKDISFKLGSPVIGSSVADLKAVAAAPSPDARLGERLKPVIAASGGKGGGGPTQVQAAFTDAVALEAFVTATAALLGGA
ncbi:MAG: alanyl-tRNA editing protein [Spirochaetales bacterium]|nr:alanyl-tRNA editing protein [Spirochaetales bacterium]